MILADLRLDCGPSHCLAAALRLRAPSCLRTYSLHRFLPCRASNRMSGNAGNQAAFTGGKAIRDEAGKGRQLKPVLKHSASGSFVPNRASKKNVCMTETKSPMHTCRPPGATLRKVRSLKYTELSHRLKMRPFLYKTMPHFCVFKNGTFQC